MCKFFSCISDGKGKVLFFKPEDIVREMSKGNPENYDWNSHSSIASFHGIKGVKEDNWNKWEYDVESMTLSIDTLNTTNDKEKVSKVLTRYFKDKKVLYLINLYNCNSGDWNSGNRNSGNRNSGDWNSGNCNSGDWNSGDRNSGDCNSGDWNSGDCNSGDCNSGDRNSGNRNSGDRNSGDCNSGDGVINHFCTQKHYLLFDKTCTKEEAQRVYDLNLWQYVKTTLWVDSNQMTDEEKSINKNHTTTGGYLKTISLEEAWKAVPDDVIKEIKKLKNFDAEKFKEITGRS